MSLSLLLLFLPIAAAQKDLGYGRWCGPGHGGFQNCCQGTFCPSCGPGPSEGQYDYVMPLQCLEECPPVDKLDLACVWHDICTYLAGQRCGRVVDGQHCFCNCLLYKAACFLAPLSPVCLLFAPLNPALDCWICQAERDVCLAEGKVGSYCGNVSQQLDILQGLQSRGDGQFNLAKDFAGTCWQKKSILV